MRCPRHLMLELSQAQVIVVAPVRLHMLCSAICKRGNHIGSFLWFLLDSHRVSYGLRQYRVKYRA